MRGEMGHDQLCWQMAILEESPPDNLKLSSILINQFLIEKTVLSSTNKLIISVLFLKFT